jgi:tetratricopeptide (TPR) repeat protein
MSVRERKRGQAQELAWEAMDAMESGDSERAGRLRHEALAIYPDCVDARTILAQIECEHTKDYVEKLREAIEAGRRDLGAAFFKDERGYFWGLIETRPFMRAMASLAFALLDWGTPERVDEAIAVFEEMLELNPNDNQGVRDALVGCYLARKRYTEAATLLERYGDDCLATPAWAQVLLAFATEGEGAASPLLAEARERNEHVEAYLTGRKRRPRRLPGLYSPGDESEAIMCVHLLQEAWKAHPKAKRWLKSLGEASN